MNVAPIIASRRMAVLLASALLSLTPSAALASAPAADPEAAAFEVDFMKEMIDHHAMAVEMAEMCVERATHRPLRNVCEDIATSQSQEMRRMQRWLDRWYEEEHEPRMSEEDEEDMMRLEEATGRRFEIRFMRMMIRHHRMAIEMARDCLERAEHPQLRGLCEDIIEAQEKEIRKLERWLCAWYDRRCTKD